MHCHLIATSINKSTQSCELLYELRHLTFLRNAGLSALKTQIQLLNLIQIELKHLRQLDEVLSARKLDLVQIALKWANQAGYYDLSVPQA